METIKKNSSKIVFLAVIALVCSWAMLGNAGNLNPSAPPGPTMKTLDEVYDAVQSASSGILQREGFFGKFDFPPGYGVIEAFTVQPGKCFVLLKVAFHDMSTYLTVEGTSRQIVAFHFPNAPNYAVSIDIPDRSFVVNAGETVNLTCSTGNTFAYIFGYYYDVP